MMGKGTYNVASQVLAFGRGLVETVESECVSSYEVIVLIFLHTKGGGDVICSSRGGPGKER